MSDPKFLEYLDNEKKNLIEKKNNNLNLFTTKSGEFFTQQLEIYN